MPAAPPSPSVEPPPSHLTASSSTLHLHRLGRIDSGVADLLPEPDPTAVTVQCLDTALAQDAGLMLAPPSSRPRRLSGIRRTASRKSAADGVTEPAAPQPQHLPRAQSDVDGEGSPQAWKRQLANALQRQAGGVASRRVSGAWSGLRHKQLAPLTIPSPPPNAGPLSRTTPRGGLSHSASSPNFAAVDTRSLVKPEARTKNYRPFLEEYSLGEAVGTGGYAVVRRCVHKATGCEYAVKLMVVAEDDSEDADREMTATDIANELALMQRHHHPNICKLHEYFINDGKCCMVMDLLRGEELMDALLDIGAYDEEDAKVIMRHLLDAIAHMHSQGVTHRDLKLENLVLAAPGDIATVTIVDFGLAKSARARERMEEYCGTKEYTAPEILSGKPYTCAVDAWSLGVALHILLSGRFPFEDECQEDLIDAICLGDVDLDAEEWDDISNEAQDLLQGLLQVDPKRRLSPGQALEHAWFTGVPYHDSATLRHIHQRLSQQQEQRWECVSPPPVPRVFAPGETMLALGARIRPEILLIKSGECEVLRRPLPGAAAKFDITPAGLVHLGRRREGNFVGELCVCYDDATSSSPLIACRRLSITSRGEECEAPPTCHPHLEADSSAAGRFAACVRLALTLLRVRRVWVGRRGPAYVRAITRVEVLVCDSKGMEWAAEHDFRLCEELQDVLKMRRIRMRESMRQERLRDRQEYLERRSGVSDGTE